MTLAEFDELRSGDGIEFTNPVSGDKVVGVVRRRGDDEVSIQWEDGERMRVLRHEVRIYYWLYQPFKVLQW